MSVLIEAKDGRGVGEAYFPYAKSWDKQKVPVQVVDLDWLKKTWPMIKPLLEGADAERWRALAQLKQALEGQSAGRAEQSDAVNRVVDWSRPVQSSMANIDRDLEQHGTDFVTADGHKVFRAAEMPLVYGTNDAAAAFLIGLKDNASALAAAEITIGLGRTQPCVWLRKDSTKKWKERRQFGLFCPDFLSAAYAVSILGFGIAACLRCGNVFLRSRSDDQFCSPRCQNTFLVARRRREQRAKRRTRKTKGRRKAKA